MSCIKLFVNDKTMIDRIDYEVQQKLFKLQINYLINYHRFVVEDISESFNS